MAGLVQQRKLTDYERRILSHLLSPERSQVGLMAGPALHKYGATSALASAS